VTLEPVDEALLDRRMEHIAVKTPGLEIGTVGAVDVRYKGQQFVIEALAALKRKGRNDFTYHLVGGGDQGFLRAEAERCGVQDQVVFHGSMTHDDVFSFLDTIDVYVQPSLQEGLPRSLIEAMSRGLLCLGAATGGIPELLEDRYVFRKRASGGIARILAGITEDDLCAQATRNFEEAKKYQLELIEQRRDIMFARAIEESYKGKTET
jgi:glycosyltransferase involved in cell wall biosynthesis